MTTAYSVFAEFNSVGWDTFLLQTILKYIKGKKNHIKKRNHNRLKKYIEKYFGSVQISLVCFFFFFCVQKYFFIEIRKKNYIISNFVHQKRLPFPHSLIIFEEHHSKISLSVFDPTIA